MQCTTTNYPKSSTVGGDLSVIQIFSYPNFHLTKPRPLNNDTDIHTYFNIKFLSKHSSYPNTLHSQHVRMLYNYTQVTRFSASILHAVTL